MASVKQSWIKKYGEEEGLRKFNEHKKNYGKTKNQLIDKYGVDYVNKLSIKKKTYGLESCIRKYGPIEGPIKWEEQKNKKLITQKNNKSLGLHKTSAITLETLTSKYGIDDGTNRYAKYLEKQKYAHSKQSFLDKYGDTIGEQKWEDYLRSKDNTSLKSFIKRHGEEDGRIRYAENCKKCSTTLDNMILKFGVEEGTKRYTAKRLKAIAALSNVNTVSKISQRIFWDIYNVLHDSFKEYCRFAELNDESRFYFHKPKKINCYKIDFKCGKVIIEYNGKYWHRNTTEYDNIRKQDLESIGYTVIFISEDDIKKEIYNNTINNLKKIIHDKAFIKPK